MSKICNILLEWKENAVSFDDCDSMTDYYHGYRLGQKQTIAWVKDKGGKVITIEVVNDDKEIPAQKRVENIAKICGYSVKDQSRIREYHAYNNEIVKIFHMEWLLTKEN